jgi:hypothetical protein
MIQKEFAAGYPEVLQPTRLLEHAYTPGMEEAQQQSHDFGTMLHIASSGDEQKIKELLFKDPADEKTFKNPFGPYQHWVQGNFNAVVEETSKLPIAQRARSINMFNFHELNTLMIPMWAPMLDNGWDSVEQRGVSIRLAQNHLALRGLEHYKKREDFLSQHGTHAIKDPAFEETHNALTGAIHEFDTAIILLEIVRRHKNLTVVPAPAQFEQSPKGDRNVDFVVVDFENNKAVGVQAKTQVNSQQYQEADQDRVVFVDGSIDFNSIRPLRVKKGSSREQIVSWPGVIAAKNVHDIKTHGKNIPPAARTNLPFVLRQKRIADRLVDNLRIDQENIVKNIGARILERL